MQPLVERYKPTRLADFAGLDAIRGMFARFAESPYSSAWLLVGPAGVGKTTMAYALAAEIGAEVHHIASRSCNLETVQQIRHDCSYYPFGGEFHAVIVDEADQMTAAAQVAFLSLLDGTEAPSVPTIFIFTCNSTKGLEPRFKQRTRVIEFSLASDIESAAAFLERVWRAETGAAVPDLAALFADCDYSVRDALMKLEVKISMLPRFVQRKQAGRFVEIADGRSVWVTV